MMRPIEYSANPVPDENKYLIGRENFLIRMYFYLTRGLEIPNNFRNLILGIGAVYITMKLDNLLIAVALFIGSAIILTIFGWYNVHRLSKVQEALSMRFSTIFGIKAFNFQEKQTKLLEEILKELKANKKSNE